MKLRNKNTGEIGVINLKVYGDDTNYVYDKLETLYEDWEDIVPKELLIKDEKIRRAVLAWSSAYNESREKEVRCIQFCEGTDLVATDNCMCRITLPSLPELLHLNVYTIKELCGEDEE